MSSVQVPFAFRSFNSCVVVYEALQYIHRNMDRKIVFLYGLLWLSLANISCKLLFLWNMVMRLHVRALQLYGKKKVFIVMVVKRPKDGHRMGVTCASKDFPIDCGYFYYRSSWFSFTRYLWALLSCQDLHVEVKLLTLDLCINI